MLQLFLLSAVTSTLGCEPGSVKNLNVTRVRSSEIIVSWSPPPVPDAQCIHGYRICLTSDDNSVSCTNVENASLSEYAITDLPRCTLFNISVIALGESNVESVPVYVLARTAPKPAYNIGVTRKDNETITVLWTYNFTPDKDCVKQFELSLCDGPNATAICTSTMIGVAGSFYRHDIKRKLDCKKYFLNLVVLDGYQQRSDDMQFVSDTEVISAPENLTVSRLTSSSFDIMWVIPAAQMDCEYFVYVNVKYEVGITTHSSVTLYNPGRTNHSVENITSCTAVNVSVSFKSTGSELDRYIDVYTLPEDDKLFNNATVQDETSSSMMVEWITGTTLKNKECIEAYIVCWNKERTIGRACKNATRDQSNLRITGLEANSKYQVSVAALLKSGIQFDNISLDASTMSGAPGLLHGYMIGFSTLIFYFLRQYC